MYGRSLLDVLAVHGNFVCMKIPVKKGVLLFMILVIDSSGDQDLLFFTSEVIAGFADVGC
jgi:hypothetical protein